jgi:phosphatidylserine decarboxylase
MKIVQQEELNFLVTNCIPRRLTTRFIGWFSRIEHPVVRDLSIGAWKFFADLDLSDAREAQFRSMHDCFTRQLVDGARPVEMDPGILVSPCDAIVGACGDIADGQILQVKGFSYALGDLLDDTEQAAALSDGCYVTLRLTSSMYHRFHAPRDCCVESVVHIGGDTWNVNPIALKRVERLYCRNERAVIRASLSGSGTMVVMVAVAAILVAGIRLRFVDMTPARRDRGARRFPCMAPLRKGEEMGWFEHGSTILVFVPKGFGLCDGVKEGVTIRMGQSLMDERFGTA